MRFLLAALLLAGAGAAALRGTEALRRMPWFMIERVEISGTRLLAPHEVLAASGIRGGQSIWERLSPWEAALRGHPVIADAQVSRRLPRTLRIRVQERRPVALLDAGALRLATASGEVLPVDPTRAALDLPLLRSGGTARSSDTLMAGELRVVLADAGRIAEIEPGIAARVSEIRPGAPGELLLLLSQPAAEVLLPVGAPASRFRQLRAVLEELARRPAGERPIHLDLRFEAQVVARF